MPSPVPGVAPLEQGGFGGTNPLGLISGLAGIQNQLNENRKFQQEFYANQAAGEIIAKHPGDLEGAIQEMQGSGLAGFMGPAINNARSLALMQAQQQQIEASGIATMQGAVLSGRDAVIRAGLGAVKDFTKFPIYARASLAGLDPKIRDAEAQYITDISKALYSDVVDPKTGEVTPFNVIAKNDPKRAQDVFNQRYNGFMTAAGVSAPEVGALVGAPKEFESGARTTYGPGPTTTGSAWGPGPGQVQLPPGTPQTPEGALAKELPPTLAQQGQQAAGGAQGLPPGGGAPQGAAPGPQAGAEGAAPGYRYATGIDPKTTAFDGKPLVNKPEMMRYTGWDNSAVGGLNAQQVKQNADALERIHESDKAATAAQQTQNFLQTMDESLDYLSHNLTSDQARNRVLVAGPLAGPILAFGKTVNEVAGAFGGKPVFAQDPLAIMENIAKTHEQLKYSFLSQNLGTQREAASTIINAGQAVPGLENTLLGGKLVTAEVRAATQWLVDHNKFVNEYTTANKGTAINAEQAWMAQHDPKDYARKVLEQFGIGPDGKMSVDMIGKQMRDGFLSQDEAKKLLHSMYPGKYTDTRAKQ